MQSNNFPVFDTNIVQAKMLERAGPSFSELRLQQIKNGQSKKSVHVKTAKSYFFGNQGKRITQCLRHTAPSHYPPMLENYSVVR